MLPEADRLEPKMRTPKSQSQSGGRREGKLAIGLGRVWGWEEGRAVVATQHAMSSRPLFLGP